MSIEGETIEVRPGESFAFGEVERYLRKTIASLGPEKMIVKQFPSGASNLTYLIKIGAWEGVLRRPPQGPVAPKAHDMKREAGLLQRIAPIFPLAPHPYCFCEDLTVLGVPFYVMERRHGVVLNDGMPSGRRIDEERCRQLSNAVVETLVQIHSLNWKSADLAQFGYPTGFLARQVKNWIERYYRAQTDTIAEVESLTDWLTQNVPQSATTSLIHNDFKLNNMLLDAENIARPVAVLDWEMATIGDPLFDLSISLSYWLQPEDPEELKTIIPIVTLMPGFISRETFMEIYARKSGYDLSAMHFYMTFAYFKLAVILQQIYVRWKRGQTQDARFAPFGGHARCLIRHAVRLVERGRL